MTFLIARPHDKALNTKREFTLAGLKASVLPAISIDIHQTPKFTKRLNQSKPEIIILTSTYAVEWLDQLLCKQALTFDINSVIFACIGKRTATRLKESICKHCSSPPNSDNILGAQPENSEGLLTLPCFSDIDGR